MKVLMVPKPILSSDMSILGYCFRYNQADELITNQPSRIFEGAMSTPCLDVLELVGLDALTGGQEIFVPLNKMSLFVSVEHRCSVPSEKIIFLLDEDVDPAEPFLSKIKEKKNLGYRFAIEGITNYDKMVPILKLCDFVFIDCRTANYKQTLQNLNNRHPHLIRLAANVHTMSMFDNIKRSSYHGFEGKFYSTPSKRVRQSIAPIKVNRIQLMNAVRDDDFEIEEIVKIVSQDPSLSISLLRFVNSPYLNLSQQVKTISHAVAMLGQKEVRKWVITATSGLLGDDKPDETTKLSLMRAKFAESLSPQFEMAIHAPSLFLMGLFSILDVVLDVPMDEALKVVKVTDQIHEALVSSKGEYAKVFNLIKAYESADWNEVSRLMVLHKLDAQNIYDSYIDTVKWYGAIISPAEEESAE